MPCVNKVCDLKGYTQVCSVLFTGSNGSFTAILHMKAIKAMWTVINWDPIQFNVASVPGGSITYTAQGFTLMNPFLFVGNSLFYRVPVLYSDGTTDNLVGYFSINGNVPIFVLPTTTASSSSKTITIYGNSAVYNQCNQCC